MFLQTERLILRKFREEDFADFCAYSMGPEMSRMMGDLLDNEKDVRIAFDWLKDREERGYVLVLKETGHVIGNLSVTATPDHLARLPALAGKQGRSMSYCISRHYRRQGLMSEALRAVIDHLFDAEGMDYVQCGCFDFNIPSRALQEKLGFTHLIALEDNIHGEHVLVNEQILWKSDWRKKKK